MKQHSELFLDENWQWIHPHYGKEMLPPGTVTHIMLFESQDKPFGEKMINCQWLEIGKSLPQWKIWTSGKSEMADAIKFAKKLKQFSPTKSYINFDD